MCRAYSTCVTRREGAKNDARLRDGHVALERNDAAYAHTIHIRHELRSNGICQFCTGEGGKN